MFLISDENSTKRFPIVTLSLILANLVVFFCWQWQTGLTHSVTLAGLVPTQLHPISLTGIKHVFTSMFMHGGIMHVVGNMWFLWIFGDNVEDEIGRFSFIVFYLLSGVLAAVTYVAFNKHSVIPMVGASGAISGVLGGYLVLHPNARVKLLFWFRFIRLPAWFYLLFWIGFQVLALSSVNKAFGSHIAYGAHIGGLVAGIVLATVVLPRQNPKDF